MPRQILPVSVLALVAGCLSQPDVTVLDRAHLAQSHVKRAEPPGAVAGIDPSKELTVGEAVRIALVNNPDIGKALARVRQARANLRRAYSRFLPTLDASAGWTRWLERGTSRRG